jgi:hypothetical protein
LRRDSFLVLLGGTMTGAVSNDPFVVAMSPNEFDDETQKASAVVVDCKGDIRPC